jgi:PhnB protein
MLMRFKENPEPAMNPPGSGEKIMHASFRIGKARVMAAEADRFGVSWMVIVPA